MLIINLLYTDYKRKRREWSSSSRSKCWKKRKRIGKRREDAEGPRGVSNPKKVGCMLMMDVYYAVCRFCCCCPDNSDHERQQDWRQQKKDIEYVLHQQDINASSAQQSGGQNLSASLHPNSVGTPTHSAKYVPYCLFNPVICARFW